MLIVGRNAIPHSKPHRTNHIPNWRTKIEPLKEMALFWHNDYFERGRPDSGFYFEMRKYSRKVYHAIRRGHYKTANVQKITNIARCFTFKQFNCKYMSLYLDFKYLQCDVLSNMISTYCLDAYASQLWDYEDKRIEKYYVAWRKAMMKVWKLPNLTHCNLLPVITNLFGVLLIVKI